MAVLQHQQSRKIAFYLRGGVEYVFVPNSYYRWRLSSWLALANQYDPSEINRRVCYYHKLDRPFDVPEEALRMDQIPKKKATYYIDLRRILRHFPPSVRAYARFGDVTDVSTSPSFVKTRPIEEPNANSVLLRLNSIRHFRPIADPRHAKFSYDRF